jgi:excisionase family DNA binding protein
MSEPDLLTVPEVAQLLRVSRGTVSRWISDGVLSSVRLGRHRRVSRSQLDGFLARLERDGSVPPAWPHAKARSSPGSTRRVDR